MVPAGKGRWWSDWGKRGKRVMVTVCPACYEHLYGKAI